MKLNTKFLSFVALSIFLSISGLFAQAPQKMSYQAVIRNTSNALVVNQAVGMKISILHGSLNGSAVYVETQTPATNANGLASVQIGGGIVVSGVFSSINWANGPFFVKTETDPTGGINYTISGTSQLLSVPYAFYSNKSDSAYFANNALNSDSAKHAIESNHAIYADSVVQKRAYIYIRKKATLQFIPTSVNTKMINYDTVVKQDFTFNNSTGEVTFEKSGLYILTAHTSFDAMPIGRKVVWLDCTSSNHPARIASQELTETGSRVSTTFVGEFNAGDKISFSVFQSTGNNVQTPAAQTYDETQLRIEKLY